MKGTERNLTASELIRRFREDRPLPKEEREKHRHQMGLGDKMWWESDKDRNNQSNSVKIDRNQINPVQVDQPPVRESIDSIDDFIPRSSLRMSDAANLRTSIGSDRSYLRNSGVDRFNSSERNFNTRRPVDIPNRSIDSFNFSMDGLLRGDPNTLGASGLLGLHTENLKLDGRKGDQELISQQPISQLNSSLEELLKQLNVDHPPKEQAMSIPEIVQQLDVEFTNLLSRYDSKDKERKATEEKLREEGRVEERQKRLLDDFDQASAFLDDKPRVKFSLPTVEALSSTTAATTTTTKLADGISPAMPHRLLPLPHDDISRWQFTLDRELDTADTIYKQMRALRVKLMQQLRKDAMTGVRPGEDKRTDNEEWGVGESKDYESSSSGIGSRENHEKHSMAIPVDPKILLKTVREIDISLSATMTALHHRLPEPIEPVTSDSSSQSKRKEGEGESKPRILEVNTNTCSSTGKTKSIGVGTEDEVVEEIIVGPAKKPLEVELEAIDKILDFQKVPTVLGIERRQFDPIREVRGTQYVLSSKKPIHQAPEAYLVKPTAPPAPFYPAEIRTRPLTGPSPTGAPPPQQQPSYQTYQNLLPPTSNHQYPQSHPQQSSTYYNTASMTRDASPHRNVWMIPSSATLKEKKTYLQQVQALREHHFY